jgi:hypothetical protein
MLILLAVTLSFLVAFPVMWMIDWIFTPQALQAAVGTPYLPYWKAYWLLCLCNVLFGSSLRTE